MRHTTAGFFLAKQDIPFHIENEPPYIAQASVECRGVNAIALKVSGTEGHCEIELTAEEAARVSAAISEMVDLSCAMERDLRGLDQ